MPQCLIQTCLNCEAFVQSDLIISLLLDSQTDLYVIWQRARDVHAKTRPLCGWSTFAMCARKTQNKSSWKSAETVSSLLTVLGSFDWNYEVTTFEIQLTRLTVIPQSDTHQLFSWHKDCRSNYKSKSKIERLRMTAQEGMTGQISSPSTSMSSPQNVSLRSKTPQLDWNQCIYCQQNKKTSLHLILYCLYKKWTSAREYWKLHSKASFLGVRLACVNDLTAADGKYHRNCLTDFDCRSKHKVNISFTSPEIVLAWLCQELEHAAEQADILDLADVWARYCDISDSVQIDILSPFQTRRNTFKEKLVDRLKRHLWNLSSSWPA